MPGCGVNDLDALRLGGIEGLSLIEPLPLRLRSPPLLPAYPSHGLEPVTPTLSTHMPCEQELEASAKSAIWPYLVH